MKILIDGDACSVLKTTERIARYYNVECHVYCNARHTVNSSYSSIHLTDVTKDAADFAIINQCKKHDVIITSDGGLAAIVLSKGATPINPYHGEYTEDGIAQILYCRHIRSRYLKKNHKKQNRLSQLYPHEKRESYKDTLHRIVRQNREAEIREEP